MGMEWISAVWAKYDEMAQQIADQMAELPWPQSRISPDEGAASTLRNSWEEFALEVQEDQSFYWDAYESQIRLLARPLISELDWQDTALLWAATDASSEYAEDETTIH